jgi:hypothetical protein
MRWAFLWVALISTVGGWLARDALSMLNGVGKERLPVSQETCIPCTHFKGKMLLPRRECCLPSTQLLTGGFNSQFQEDRSVYTKIFKNTVRKGFFVEIGARNGLVTSNTLFFERQLGWTGLLIEPNPKDFQQLAKNRPGCIRLHAAVCNATTDLHYIERKDVGGIYEFMAPSFLKMWHKKLPPVDTLPKIICMPFRRIFEAPLLRHVQHIDFFSLDVEGAELSALTTFPFEKITVSVWAVEADMHSPAKNAKVRKMLKQHGYESLGRLTLSEIFISTRLMHQQKINVRFAHPY